MLIRPGLLPDRILALLRETPGQSSGQLSRALQAPDNRTREAIGRLYDLGLISRTGPSTRFLYSLPRNVEVEWKPDMIRPLVASIGVSP